MSRFLGEIKQLGYVVEDIDAAMKYWTEVLGVGPFYYMERVPLKNYRYRGQAYDIHNSVALANSGGVQVELIQQRSDTPSMYRDFMRGGRTGLQHLAYWTEDFDRDLQRLLDRGWKVGMSGEVGERGRFVYFETEYHPGTVIELSEVAGPKGKVFRLIREAAEQWDGSEPVRAFPDLGKM
ncbi:MULTISPECIES: VOC family protein [unclassified Herbaspirillum]|uniref:VOC family protein n=1 Tax=unclassified Herbaspirillum TaxID=2624150 RepID=UPI00114EF412|nr:MULTISPECIES: VOC family protein [unclassified Herbaspirillum]MBB5390625.1 catechol 2,3-dioxygenase-like lactoylglutathione lyase family enzyme [Herbaspirillum sp. SJZ102]TQK08889.1 glyoxalase/bleomycin resistance protein/dioxygenase superfamily protein [Herbaspirillum sp. SJZ130]TQK14424.1 glyoxalase/bleomycin resistance protein/dioxygenase superfamily protein [Herbaspirillum sp. SJZ106]